MGNVVRFQLVEADRGERLGHVRAAEVHPSGGADPVLIRAQRIYEDGTPATYFADEDEIRVVAEVITPGGEAAPGLTPRDEIVLHVPVRGYQRYLPGVYRGAVPSTRRDISSADEVSARRWGHPQPEDTVVDDVSSDSLERFLFLFQHMMTSVTDRVDQIADLTDPIAADPKFLPWIASWVSFPLDGSLPVHQQRELVRRAIRLYRTRGTQEGVEEMIKVLTSASVRLAEKEKPLPMVLGAACLAGGSTIEDRYDRGAPPAFFVTNPTRSATSFFSLVLEDRDRFERRFGERARSVLRQIARVVTKERPAHVAFTIQFEDPE
jgi:phage tail-like protein